MYRKAIKYKKMYLTSLMSSLKLNQSNILELRYDITDIIK